MSENTVPIDATAMQAEDLIKAALDWRYDQSGDPILNRNEWLLYEACNRYGDRYKGLRAQ